MPQTNYHGYTLPTLNGLADHTYVRNDAGDVYPCWGRSSGGRQICSNSGSQSHANCLAQPDLKAGIKYGISGVCHQTANRILFPSRQFVSKAKGYRSSVFVWGIYGRFGWKERKQCQHSAPESHEPKPTNLIQRFDLDMFLLHGEGIDIKAFPDGIPYEELDIMVGRFLPDLASSQRDTLLMYQQALHKKMDELLSMLTEQIIGAPSYVQRLNDAQTETFSKCHDILSNKGFSTLFGAEPEQAGSFVNEQIFLENFSL